MSKRCARASVPFHIQSRPNSRSMRRRSSMSSNGDTRNHCMENVPRSSIAGLNALGDGRGLCRKVQATHYLHNFCPSGSLFHTVSAARTCDGPELLRPDSKTASKSCRAFSPLPNRCERPFHVWLTDRGDCFRPEVLKACPWRSDERRGRIQKL
jgi:hypothetical protein